MGVSTAALTPGGISATSPSNTIKKIRYISLHMNTLSRFLLLCTQIGLLVGLTGIYILTKKEERDIFERLISAPNRGRLGIAATSMREDLIITRNKEDEEITQPISLNKATVTWLI